MALLNNLSIRWKLSLALVATGLGLVIAYVVVAKNVFESDKLSYVFEAQNSSVASLKQEFNSQFEHAMQSMQFVTATYNPSTGKPTEIGVGIFKSERALQALELVDETTGRIVFKLEKQPGEMTDVTKPTGRSLVIQPSRDDQFIVSQRVSSPNQDTLHVSALVDLRDLLPELSPTHTVAFTRDGQLFYKADYRGVPVSTFEHVARRIRDLKLDRTSIYKDAGTVYLESAAPLGLADMQVFELTPEKEAFGALGTLFNRSLVFLAFSFFGLVAISIVLSRSLTWRLGHLTSAADQIGQGHFDVEESIDSHDEVGILKQAFVRMSREIQRLLSETREKARMEEELKTAKLVQERLLPIKPTSLVNQIEISGTVITSSECGGDWWYYFVKGDALYVAVADATGHGTPAALITAAARSVFSRLETESLTLIEMMVAWDHAISSCSGRQVLMTGLLMKIDTRTGEGFVVNSSHELPIRFSFNGSSFDYAPLEIPACGRLGDGLSGYIKEKSFNLSKNEFLLIYTDGLFAVENKSGQTLSDRRFAKSVGAQLSVSTSASQATQVVLRAFDDFRKDGSIPDDVSVVVLKMR